MPAGMVGKMTASPIESSFFRIIEKSLWFFRDQIRKGGKFGPQMGDTHSQEAENRTPSAARGNRKRGADMGPGSVRKPLRNGLCRDRRAGGRPGQGMAKSRPARNSPNRSQAVRSFAPIAAIAWPFSGLSKPTRLRPKATWPGRRNTGAAT